jgi:hypothetical protein
MQTTNLTSVFGQHDLGKTPMGKTSLKSRFIMENLEKVHQIKQQEEPVYTSQLISSLTVQFP